MIKTIGIIGVGSAAAGRPRALALVAAIFLGSLGGCSEDGGRAGAGGGAGGGDGPDASTSPFTVTGIVLDQLSAEPLAGATVILDGETVATDLSGRFTFADVEPPYDVAIRASSSESVRVYRGLTHPEPTLLARSKFGTDGFATLSGTIPLGSTTSADTVLCDLDGPRGLRGHGSAESEGLSPIAWTTDGPFPNQSARWFGENTVNGTIHCVVERRPDDVLTSAFYGTRAIALAHGGDFANQQVSVAEVELATAIAHVSAPDAFAEVKVGAGWIFEHGASHAPWTQEGAPGEHSLPMPLLSGTRTLVRARGYVGGIGSSESGVIAPAAETVEADLTLLAPPAITSPALDATVAYTDPIAWTGSGHVFLLTVTLPGRTIDVVTTEESADLPDYAPFGLDDPAGQGWIEVHEYGPVTRVDELVDGTAFIEIRDGRRDYQVAEAELISATLD